MSFITFHQELLFYISRYVTDIVLSVTYLFRFIVSSLFTDT